MLKSRLLITFAKSLDLDQDSDRTSVLISIQTIWHSDSVPERIFEKVNFEKLSGRQKYEKLLNMQRTEKICHY